MDFHFLLRNGISGGILLLLFIVGLQIADGCELLRLYQFWEPLQGSSAILIAATPILGILLQGIYLLFLYRIGHMFSDDARFLVAERFRSIEEEHSAWPERFKRPLHFYYDDSIFVAFYHSHAPSHLIEWARRRRSYHYLGWTASIGALVGLTLGFTWSGTPWTKIIIRLFCGTLDIFYPFSDNCNYFCFVPCDKNAARC